MNIKSIILAPLVILALGTVVACGDGRHAAAAQNEEPPILGYARITCVSAGEVYIDDYGSYSTFGFGDSSFRYTSTTLESDFHVYGDCVIEKDAYAPAGWTPIIPGRSFEELATTANPEN